MDKATALIGKIAGVFLLQKTVSAGNSLIENLLAGLAVVLVLSFLTTLLFGFLIIGGVYVGFQALLAYGYSGQASALIIGAVLLCLLVGLISTIVICVQKIRGIPKRLVTHELPVVNVFNQLADAFVEGFRKP